MEDADGTITEFGGEYDALFGYETFPAMVTTESE